MIEHSNYSFVLLNWCCRLRCKWTDGECFLFDWPKVSSIKNSPIHFNNTHVFETFT